MYFVFFDNPIICIEPEAVIQVTWPLFSFAALLIVKGSLRGFTLQIVK